VAVAQEQGNRGIWFMFNEILDVQEVLHTLLYFVVLLGVTIICMFIFEMITPYNDREQLLKGNKAVAIQFFGKIIGITLIMKSAIATNDSLLGAAIWGVIGFVLMLIGYFIFEFLTPRVRVDKEIESGNVAVGIIAASISLAIALITSGAIS